MDTSKSAISSGISPSSEDAAKVAWQAAREIFPSQNKESEFSLRLRIKLMAQICEEIGPDRFMEAVEKAISVSFGRYAVSPAKIRECAGLKWTPPPSAAATAWQFVTDFYLNHVRPDPKGTGNYVFEEKIVNFGGVARVFPVPEIPPAVSRAIRAIGGWAAIAEAWPEFIGQRYGQFKEFYHEDGTGLCVDRENGRVR
jgi:hypothetical protein